MTLKLWLATLSLFCELIGGFLLAVPMVFGVNNLLRSILGMRSSLRRLHRKHLPHRRYLFPQALTSYTSPDDPGDYLKERAGEQFNLQPLYLITCLILYPWSVWHFFGNYIIAAFQPNHAAINRLEGLIGHLRYPLHVIMGAL